MNLRLKFGIVLLVITLLLSAAIYGGLELYKGETLERNRVAVDETSELAAEQIEATLAERMDYVGFVASRPEAARLNRSGPYLDGILSSTRFSAGQVVAANGTVVSFRGAIDRTTRQETVRTEVSDQPYFRRGLNRSVHVSDPGYVERADEHLVVISAPIFERGEIVGVLALSMYITDETFFNSVVPVDTSARSVRIEAGDAVLYENDERFAQATTASATVEPVGWTLTVSRDRSRLNTQFRSLAIAQPLGLFVVLVSVLSFGVWEYRENLQQTERLLEGFSSFREGNYDHTVELSTAEEWQQIGDGFDELTDALAARERAIREREQRLEVLNRVLRHNLRNEMSVVLNYAELVREFTDDGRVRAAVENIRDVGQDLVETGEKARRLDTTLEETDPEPVDVVEAVDSAVERVRATHPSASFDVDLPGPRGPPPYPASDSPSRTPARTRSSTTTDPSPTSGCR
jgi:signal transduction histidine kinase